MCFCSRFLALSLSRRSLDVFDFANYISVFRALSFAGARARAAYAFNLSRSRRRRTRRRAPAVLMKLYSRDNCISRACYKRSGAHTHTLAPASPQTQRTRLKFSALASRVRKHRVSVGRLAATTATTAAAAGDRCVCVNISDGMC